MTNDGCRVWVSVAGEGTPLVFCHGGPGIWDYFGELAASFAGGRTCVRWDQRGCGRSRRVGPYTLERYLADLEAVREHVRAPRLALLGHSWGAYLALRYAMAYPHRVSHLIYVSGTGIDPDRPWHAGYARNLRVQLGERRPRWEALRERDRTPEEEREFAVLQWSADFVDAGTALSRSERFATPWFGVNYECNRALNAEQNGQLVSTDLAAACTRLRVPTLIVDGARDIRPRTAVDSLHRALPYSQRVTFPDAGHMPWVEDFDGFSGVVTRFLDHGSSAP